MTGILDLDGQRAIVEQNDGSLAIYSIGDIEKKPGGAWGLADGATPSGGFEVEGLHVGGEITTPSVPTESDLPNPADTSAGAEVFVEDESRYYRLEGSV